MPKVPQRYHKSSLQKNSLRKKRAPLPKIQKKRTVKRRRKQTAMKETTFAAIVGLCICICVVIVIVNALSTNHNQTTTGANYLEGKPTISANFINSVLAYYHSPASGKGQALYDDGVKYDIDPAYALAFFMHESTLGTQGIATITHSLGNIRATPDYPEYQGYRKYATWEEGFEDWYKLISLQYIHEWNLQTLEQIIPVYAPAADDNDEEQYISSVEYMVTTWRDGTITIP